MTAQCLNQQGQCDVLFSKAFDRVPHSRLFHEIQFYGIREPLFNWITNFLSDRSQQVVLNNKQSNTRNVVSGIPQETVLTLLFLIYTNDLPTSVISKVGLYADGVILYSNISSMEVHDLDLLTQWSHK